MDLASGLAYSDAQEQQHITHFRDFVTEQCAKLAEQILAQYTSVLQGFNKGAAKGTAAGVQQPPTAAQPLVASAVGPRSGCCEAVLGQVEGGTRAWACAEHASQWRQRGGLLRAPPGSASLAVALPPEVSELPIEGGGSVRPRVVMPLAPANDDEAVAAPPSPAERGAVPRCDEVEHEEVEEMLEGGVQVRPWATVKRVPRHEPDTPRVVLFMDMSPECDDECALLFLLSTLNHKQMTAQIDLIMADSTVRYRWMEQLFKDKFTGKGEWNMHARGDGFHVGGVVVDFYVLHSARREEMAVKDFAMKAPLLDIAGPCVINPKPHSLVPAGRVDVVLVAAPIPELDPHFFARFQNVRANCVVGTPGGINCQQPSWSILLSSLHKLGPVLYLAPQFTRLVRFPKSYVQDNPHWTPYMKRAVFDLALTCMARRPEFQVRMGDWGLILRLNAANAKLCVAWFQDVMGKNISEVDSCSDFTRSIVQAYVDRNSGNDRSIGGVVNELQLLGVSLTADVDSKGQPLTDEARSLVLEAYRKELFRSVYLCVITAETILFQNEANFKLNAGTGHFRTLHPRCGYVDPHQSLSSIYGVEDAIEILRDLPIQSLTPAYDMLGAIFAMQFIERGSLEDLGLEIEPADAWMGTALLTDSPVPLHPIMLVGEQRQAVVDRVVGMLNWEVEHDPVLFLDDFWARWRGSIGKVSGAYHDDAALMDPSLMQWSAGRPYKLQEMTSTRTRGSGRFDHLVIHPASAWSLPWAVATLLCITYDFVTVPLQVFGLDQHIQVVLLTVVFWTMDTMRSFFVGYYRNGSVEMRLASTACKYAQTWFILDFLVTACDWSYIFSEETMLLNSRVVAYIRLLRIFRSIRLLKLLQIPAAGELFAETLRIPAVAGAFKVIPMMSFIFAMMHVAACGWYFLASPYAVEPQDVTWVTEAHLQTATWPLLYTTSLHWALAHLLLGEVDVIATNSGERLYACLVFLLGLVVFSSFVSTLTEFMSEIAAKSAEKKKQDEAVQLYFDKNMVSATLANQIQLFRRHTRQISQKSTPRHEIEGLRHIPKSLAIKLNGEVYCPRLKEHGFFLELSKKSDKHLSRAVSTFISEDAYLSKDEVFLPGQNAVSIFIVMEGELEYTSGHKSRLAVPVGAGSWLSEPALWLIWKRHGLLQSTSGSCLMTLSIAGFREWVTAEVQDGLFAAKFAELQARDLLNLETPLAELSDLHMDALSVQAVARRASQMTGYRGSMEKKRAAFNSC